jgi:hypothetical protein
VAYLLKLRIVASRDGRCYGMALQTRPLLCSLHVMAPTDTHATKEELLEAVFSVQSVSMLYNEDKLSLCVLRR